MLNFKNRLIGFTRRSMAQHLARREQEVRLTRAIISFTFDDFPHSAWATGGEILRRHNLTATYYVALGLTRSVQPTGNMFLPTDLEPLVQAGHELGCHTYSHCDAWHTPPRLFETAIMENQRALTEWSFARENKTPLTEFKTFSYPISSPRPANKRIAAKYFSCCRGGGQKINQGRIDLNNLNAFFLEQSRNDFEAIREIIDQNEREKGWLIFATHDISQKPTRFGCVPEFFELVVNQAARSNALILPVFRAFQQINGSSISAP